MHTSTATVQALLGAGLSGVLALTGAVTTTSSATAGTAATSTATEDPGELLLMLDASGSMKEPDPAGGTKMAAAKKALTGVVDSLPRDAHVGLRVYGATEPGGTPTKAACADTQLAVPIGPVDKPALTKAIRGFEAKGETPIAHSLTKAMDDLGTKGKRNIVLVSDGEESCVPDPCPVVKKLVKNGVDLRIDTVGFGVKDTARKQLQCIADAGDGTYYDAKDADQLATSLTKISTRAVRQFSVEGTPITLTEDKTDAPTVTPGRYTDTFSVSAEPRYARIKRTPNSIVHIGLVARPPFQDREMNDSEFWEIITYTPDGEQCTRGYSTSTEFFRGVESITVGTSVNNQVTDPAADNACATSDELLLEVTHDEGKGTDIPVQLVYVEEPPVRDPDSLPAPLDGEKITGWTAKGDGSAEPVVGGGGFADAATLAPGSYEETILAGEQLYYRVRVGYGQRAAFTARVSTEGTPLGEGGSQELDSTDYILFTVNSWNPALREITRINEGEPENREHLSSHAHSLVLGEYIPEVRYRNKDASTYGSDHEEFDHASMSGYYYFAIGRESSRGDDLDAPLTAQIDVDVKGEISGEPRFAGAADTSAQSPSPTTDGHGTSSNSDNTRASTTTSQDEGGSRLPWIGGGLLAAIVLVSGAWFGLRRKGSSQSERSQE
ncbi:vWA domain-containing protein [Janibacter cremeus]|uniref:Ca-activated chloride channel family protein n=1 Tax=Janibacter cremeus TaxID=1285192 RepID=A0A852W073_9MICO|nr:VWA domain-containing protein [Janibacter cremeus]NYF99081.1 Ca-activated chloride channel family protein [Janibacter cremeus]